MRIVVTGGLGFIGSNLIRYILGNTNYEIVNYDAMTYAGSAGSLKEIENDQRYSFVKGDICDGQSVQKVWNEYSPDAVIHLAAESHVDRSIDGPSAFIRTNLLGTFEVLEASRNVFEAKKESDREAFRLIHVSTDEVYGSLGQFDESFTEESKYDPHSPYSASKAGSDHLARAWHDTYGLPVVVTNCSNNYGPFQYPEKLIPVVIHRALTGQPIPVYGDGQNIRDWLFVEDHAAALLSILEKGEPSQTYNIGGNNEIKNIDLVMTLCLILNELSPREDGRAYQQQISMVGDRPGHDFRYAIDAGKLKQEIGWEPRIGGKDGFRSTVQWYLQNKSWWEPLTKK